MAKLFIEDTSLTAIGDAIRAKTGGTDKLSPAGMVTAIEGIEGGSGGDIPEEAFVISGDTDYMFASGNWDWFLEQYGDRITTEDITNATYMFQNNSLASIPFKFNFKDATKINCEYMFNESKIEEAPLLNFPNGHEIELYNLLCGCKYLRDANGLFDNEEEFVASWQGYVNTNKYSGHYLGYLFNECYSLRTVPSWFYKLRLNSESTAYPQYYHSLYANAFKDCRTLDEVKDIPVWKCQGAMTSNMFSGIVSYCNRLKDFTFETNEDGTPIVTEWNNQTIILSNNVGFAPSADYIPSMTDYNSGITANKEVVDAESYEALKDDPDWFTCLPAFSRYDHDSIVRTINSLPDCSAYVAENGGTNTLQVLRSYKGVEVGSETGGSANDLTEEEVAIATAKGWTITYASIT